jgi:hypothetical protein
MTGGTASRTLKSAAQFEGCKIGPEAVTMKRTLALAALALLLLAAAAPATAHKTAYSSDNKIRIVWGFLNEPAVTMTKNGLDLRIVDNATAYNIPELQSTLNVSIRYGDDTHAFTDLAGQFGKPGYYTGTITPTKAGLYTLHVSGTVNGTTIDMDIPAQHEIEAIEDTYFPEMDAPGDTAALQQRVADLEAKVAALDAKLKTQATTPTDTTTQPSSTTKPAPGFEAALGLGALAAVAAVLALRRRA